MALTTEERAIASQLKQNGATSQEIMGYIGKMRVGMQPDVNSYVRTTETTDSNGSRFVETMQDVGQTVAGIVSQTKSAISNMKPAVSATLKGEQSPMEGITQVVGSGAMGASNIIGEGIKGAAKVALSEKGEKRLKDGFSAAIAPVAEVLTPIIEPIKRKYDSLDDRTKRNVDSLLGIGALFTDLAGFKGGSSVAKSAAKSVVKKVEKLIPDNAVFKSADDVLEYAAKHADDAMKTTWKERIVGIDDAMKAKIANEPELMRDYINALYAREKSLDAPSVMEFGGDRVRNAAEVMESKLNDVGTQIGNTRLRLGSYTYTQDAIDGIEKTLLNEIDKLNLKVLDGQVMKRAGDISKVSDAELREMQTLYNEFKKLKRAPDLTHGIELRDLFDKNINFAKSAREISNKLDGLSKSVRHSIKEASEKLVGKTEAQRLAQYSDYIEALNDIKSFTERNAGGEYLLRVFLSGRGGEARKSIQAIAEYTGIDLSKDAVIMKLVTELLAGDSQKTLLTQELAKIGADVGRVASGDVKAAIPIIGRFFEKRFLNPEKILKGAAGVKE